MTSAPDVGREDIVDRYQQGLPPAALRDIPEFGAFAVVVLGGGPAGIAAATTAAELGHRTLLISGTVSGGAALATGSWASMAGKPYTWTAKPVGPMGQFSIEELE